MQNIKIIILYALTRNTGKTQASHRRYTGTIAVAFTLAQQASVYVWLGFVCIGVENNKHEADFRFAYRVFCCCVLRVYIGQSESIPCI